MLGNVVRKCTRCIFLKIKRPVFSNPTGDTCVGTGMVVRSNIIFEYFNRTTYDNDDATPPIPYPNAPITTPNR